MHRVNRCVLLLPLLVACAGREPPGPRAPVDLSPVRFQSEIDRDHPLVGRLWDVAAAQFVSEDELARALAPAKFVVLGEKHDNPDHHMLQARMLGHVLSLRPEPPSVVFEMIDLSLQPKIDRALAAHPADPDALAAAVDWARSGWPDFRIYRPVFARALDAGAPIVAAGLDRDVAMRLAREGEAALDPELARRFALDRPLSDSAREALREEMRRAHCGLLPETMLDAMVLVQRARDAQFAARLHAAADPGAAVLITGNGHARKDRGVPAQLAKAFAAEALSVGLLEVQASWRDPAEYAAAFGASALPFDYVWFTPRASDEDPCEALRGAHGSHGEPEQTP
jgi:uncharacterized iron-regulated protein